MDNDTPTPDDQNNQQLPQGSGGDAESYQAEQPPLVKKNYTALIAGGVILSALAVYALSSIFSSPPPEAELNPIKDQKQGLKGGSIGIAQDGGEIAPTGDIGGAALQPVVLQPPPPPVEAAIYAPPPMVPPPMAPVPVAMEPAAASSAIPIPPVGGGRSLSEEVLGAAPPPPPPPVPPMPAISNIGKNIGKDPSDESSKKRLKSNMLVIDGGRGTAGAAGVAAAGQKAGAPVGGDRNSAFADSVIRATSAEKAVATGLSNLNMTIAQGKIVYAVLETSVNTDLPGTLRAIVSRDTYAEAGRDVLIPKGSRLIGTYNTDIIGGQSRVMVVWTRMIRPDGIDIQIGSSAVDSLGRAGAKGNVDNKFAEIFSTAMLTTAITVGAAVATEAVLPTETGTAATTTTPEGNTTSNTGPAQKAAGDAVSSFSEIGKQVVRKMVDVRPTISLDQGTLINVFVNKDLVFPSNLMSSGIFVQ